MCLYVVQRAIRNGWVMNVLAKSGHIFIELVCVTEHHWFAMQTAFCYCCNFKDGVKKAQSAIKHSQTLRDRLSFTSCMH